jgi:hypothetical protein
MANLRNNANWPADKVTRRPVAELVPAARNARTHSDELSQSRYSAARIRRAEPSERQAAANRAQAEAICGGGEMPLWAIGDASDLGTGRF